MMSKIATDKSDIVILTSDNPKKEDPCNLVTIPFCHKKSCNLFCSFIFTNMFNSSNVISGYIG